MGETNIERSETIKETDIKESGTSGTSTTSTSTADTSSKSGTRGTRGNRGDTGTGTGTTTEQTTTTPQLSVLDDEKERKPKKVINKKAKTNDLDTTQINTLIKTISTLIASRPNCSHWMLSDAEIVSITTPLTKMMQESDIFSKLGEHSNQIALVTACVTVFVPRILTSVMLIKEKKEHDRKVRKQVSQGPTNPNNGENNKSNGNAPSGENPSNNEHWTSC